MSETVTISTENLRTFMGRIIPLLDERSRRLFAGATTDMLGRGGQKLVNEITGLSRVTIIKGQNECRDLPCDPKARKTVQEQSPIRTPGGGRNTIQENQPDFRDALLGLLDGHTVGNPENVLCWTTKSTYTLVELLKVKGIVASPSSVGRFLKEEGFSLQQNRKFVEKGEPSPDRDEQFNYINETSQSFLAQGLPVISVDTKKKELVGNYKNASSEWRPGKSPRLVNAHDFEGEGGKATPYGIYDVGANEGFVNVGISADTAEFAAFSIRRWWKEMGSQRYGDAKKLLITADGGGSNSSRACLWKVQLQKLANDLNLEIHMSHFPPGTSKWNKIEHRLFAQISRTWRGQPLETLEVIISLIESTTTKTGLVVQAELDTTEYQRGIKVTDAEMASLNIERNSWRGDWNYVIRPQVEVSNRTN